MNGAQLHLLVNHIAVIGVPLCTVLLAYGLMRRQKEVTAAALALMALVALAAVPALLSGERAEDVVEQRGVPEALVEQHEELAEPVTYGAGALALLSLGALALMRRSESRMAATVVLVGALAVSGALAWTAHTGGQITHPEIRSADGWTDRAAAPSEGYDDD